MELRATGFFEPSGVLIICWGSKGGRELENNGIVLVALEAWAVATAWLKIVSSNLLYVEWKQDQERSEACVNSSAGITCPYQSPITTASTGVT